MTEHQTDARRDARTDETPRGTAALDAVGEERSALAPADATRPEAPGAAPGTPLSTWMAPESWPRTLLGVLKQTALFGVTFYTLMRLTGDSDITPTRAATTGLFTAIVALFARRSGSLTPAAPMLVLGGVTLGATLIGAATAIGLGAPPLQILGAAAIGGFLGSVMVWMGLRARRQERALDDGVRHERVAPVLIPRAELSRRIEAFRVAQIPETRRFMIRLLGGGAVILGALAFPYERVFGAELPEWAGMLLFFGMWGAFGLLARSVGARGKAMSTEFGVVCSACDRSYFSAFGNVRLQKNIEDAGCCPQCGARIITEVVR